MLRKIGELSRSETGTTLAIGTAALIPLMLLVGSAVDMSLAYRAQQRLQSACDAGVLAGRRTVTSGGFSTAAQTAATNYFNANFNPASLESEQTTFVPTSPDNGSTVRGVANTRVQTLVMQIFGYDEIALTATCEATMGVGNSDVMMVLDTTGSMSGTMGTGTRMTALQAAMRNFYDTVATATAASNARVRYGFVPYSTTVNVGRILFDENPAYLADSVAVHSRTPVFRTVTEDIFDGWSNPVSTSTSSNASAATYSSWERVNNTRYNNSTACTNALPANTSWADNGTPTSATNVFTNSSGQQVTRTVVTQPQTRTEYRCNDRRHEFRTGSRNNVITTDVIRDPVYRQVSRQEFDFWRYQQVNYDTSLYKRFQTIALPLGSSGTGQNFTWDGCIEERQSTSAASFSFSALFGISPSQATDLDLDTAPSAGNASSRWRPLLRGAGYYRETSDGNLTNSSTSLYGEAASAPCPRPARLLATMSQSEFYAYANALTPTGNTYHDIGMIWGGRLASPQGMFAGLVNDPPANGAPVARHLIFMTDGQMEPNRLVHNAYGIEYHDRRVSNDGSTPTARHNSRFLAVCEAIKAKGIRLWVIGFGTSLTTELNTCASPNSIFEASSASQLNAAFQEIARRVGELRVIQ